MSSTPLRIGYLINQYPKVSHSFIRREILALERQGVQVHRIAMRGWDSPVVDADDKAELPRTRFLMQAGGMGLLRATVGAVLRSPGRFVQACRLAWQMARHSERNKLLYAAYLAEACLAADWAREQGLSHMHAHFGTNAAAIGALVHALGGPPYSFTVHGPEEFDKPQALGLATKMQHAAFVVAISSFGRSQLLRWLPYEQWHKVKVVHCGLEPAFLDAAANTTAGEAGRLVCIGRLCEQKGQLLLIDAFAQVLARGLRARLVLAGDGEMRQAVEERIRALGVQEHVEITGWIDAARVRLELQRARSMVLPSFAEGLPVVIMEAMAANRPPLTTYVAGIPELVKDGVNGWLVPAGDVDALAQGMVRALSVSDEAAMAMGHQARDSVLARHHIDTEAAKLKALFQASTAG